MLSKQTPYEALQHLRRPLDGEPLPAQADKFPVLDAFQWASLEEALAAAYPDRMPPFDWSFERRLQASAHREVVSWLLSHRPLERPR